ncbi:MAG: zinc ABC transporter substrate-binding protein [Thaumarchaeota archaeon]|nr:zinc ABC transporter substrate-binding protein [Nitrososphaerota archaeon]
MKAGKSAGIAAAVAAVGVAIAVSLALAASGPGEQGAPMVAGGPGAAMTGGEPAAAPIVYATFYPYTEFARGVAGGAAEVRQLGPAGSGAHDWEPGAVEISTLADAIALVHSGESIEPYVDNLEEVEQLAGVTFIAATTEGKMGMHEDDERHEDDEHGDERHEDDEHGDERHEDDEHGDERHEDEHDGHDDHDDHDGHDDSLAHKWLDPIEAIEQVERIRDELAEIDPENARAYSANAMEYIGLISEIDDRYREGLAECEHDTIVTFHNAFDSMAERYGLKVLGIAHSHHAEPSVDQIARLTEYATESGARAIFYDDLTDGRLESAAVEGLGVEVVPISTLEGLAASDAPGTTYIEKMDANLAVLRDGLACR